MKMPNNPAKYEVLIEQSLRSILDISESLGKTENSGFQAQNLTLHTWCMGQLVFSKQMCK